MENSNMNKGNSVAHGKKKRPKEDILEIVKEFINYFEEVDRSQKDDNSIKRS